ncbi:hypothetical protein FHX06_006929 [Rhizobium sp. BK512]|jgi:hypothetical protein|nr:hypothetical protein [Rhizobium sp. BK512]
MKTWLHPLQQRMTAFCIEEKFIAGFLTAKIGRKPGVADFDHVTGTALSMRHGHQSLADISDRKDGKPLTNDFRAAAAIPGGHNAGDVGSVLAQRNIDRSTRAATRE